MISNGENSGTSARRSASGLDSSLGGLLGAALIEDVVRSAPSQSAGSIPASNLDAVQTVTSGDVASIASGQATAADDLDGEGPIFTQDVRDHNSDGRSDSYVWVNGLSEEGAVVDFGALDDGRTPHSHHAIDIEAGPSRNSGQTSVPILSSGDHSNASTLEVQVLDVGSNGPRLVDADVGVDEEASDTNGTLLTEDVRDHNSDGRSDSYVWVNNFSEPGAILDFGALDDGRTPHSQHLIDIEVGPSGNGQTVVPVLSSGDPSNASTVQVQILDVGSDGPRVLDADVAVDEEAVAALFDTASLADSASDANLLSGGQTLLTALSPTPQGHDLLI